LQSIINQKTSFTFEIVVGDDASTDGTRETVLAFRERHPQLVRAIPHMTRVGGVQNYFSVHNAARGEYIAHVDGDDYTLPGKLQAQADKLDQDSRCMVVWHRMKVLDAQSNTCLDDLVDPAWIDRREFCRKDLLTLGTIGFHSSKMYRAAHREFPIPPFDVLDWLATVEHVGDGFACFVGRDPLGVYRAGGPGLASSQAALTRLGTQTLDYLVGRYPEFRPNINALALKWLLEGLKNGRGEELGSLWRTWFRTLHPVAPMLLASRWREMRHLRLPKPARSSPGAAG
jgi:hypothetical protein